MAISESEIPAVPMTELAKSKYFSRPPASENVLFKWLATKTISNPWNSSLNDPSNPTIPTYRWVGSLSLWIPQFPRYLGEKYVLCGRVFFANLAKNLADRSQILTVNLEKMWSGDQVFSRFWSKIIVMKPPNNFFPRKNAPKLDKKNEKCCQPTTFLNFFCQILRWVDHKFS